MQFLPVALGWLWHHPGYLLMLAAVALAPPPPRARTRTAPAVAAGRVRAFAGFWWEHRRCPGLRVTRVPGMSGLVCPECPGHLTATVAAPWGPVR